SLLKRGVDINGQGSNTPQVASYWMDVSTVQFLLESGAEISARGGFCCKAPQPSSAEGYEFMIHLLLERGRYGSAPQAVGNYESVVQLLLEKGADVNVQGGFYGNAL